VYLFKRQFIFSNINVTLHYFEETRSEGARRRRSIYDEQSLMINRTRNTHENTRQRTIPLPEGHTTSKGASIQWSLRTGLCRTAGLQSGTRSGTHGRSGRPGSHGGAGRAGSHGRSGRPGSHGGEGRPGSHGGEGRPGSHGGAGRAGSHAGSSRGHGGAGSSRGHGGAGRPGSHGGAGRAGSHGGAGRPGSHGGAGRPGSHGGAGRPGSHGGAGRPGTPPPPLGWTWELEPFLEWTRVCERSGVVAEQGVEWRDFAWS
uniref:Uncharacterized protein n=1 Tax=Cyprinus carpio TaxID=7962 RepID=A0A8C1QZT3_CYPCA